MKQIKNVWSNINFSSRLTITSLTTFFKKNYEDCPHQKQSWLNSLDTGGELIVVDI